MEKPNLEELKEEYSLFKKKYNLPEFKKMNELFEIEKVAEHETECLLREIRKTIMDKMTAYLRFIEMLLNPTNAPIFFFSAVKILSPEDKKILEKIYTQLALFEISVVALECGYDEKKEAEFIKNISLEWECVSKDIIFIAELLKKNFSQKKSKGERGYCG